MDHIFTPKARPSRAAADSQVRGPQGPLRPLQAAKKSPAEISGISGTNSWFSGFLMAYNEV